MEWLKKMAAKIVANKERIGILFFGYTGNFLIVVVFEYVLYPWVIYNLGKEIGVPVMWFLSFLICWFTLIFYDWAKKDWLGIEAIKEVKEYEGKNIFGRIFAYAMNKGEIPALIALSVKFDPFIAVVYLRKGANNYNGLTKREWKIFLISWVVGNVYWSIAVLTGIEIFDYIKNLF